MLFSVQSLTACRKGTSSSVLLFVQPLASGLLVDTAPVCKEGHHQGALCPQSGTRPLIQTATEGLLSPSSLLTLANKAAALSNIRKHVFGLWVSISFTMMHGTSFCSLVAHLLHKNEHPSLYNCCMLCWLSPTGVTTRRAARPLLAPGTPDHTQPPEQC
jgi:hypothetical protein